MPALTLAMFILPLVAFAQSSAPLTLINEEFVKRHAAAFPNEIMVKCGCTEIEGVKLSEVLKGVERAHWDMVPASRLPVSASDGLRTWAVYDPKSQTIKFNENEMRAEGANPYRAMALNMITLHESLRSMGLSRFEENYELSTALGYVAATGDIQTAKETLSPLSGLKNGRLPSARGGSTSTGGGGNDIAALVKMLFLAMVNDTGGSWTQNTANLPELKDFSKQDRFDLAIRLRIETDPKASGEHVYVKRTPAGPIYVLPQGSLSRPLPNEEFSAVFGELLGLVAHESHP